MGMMVVFIMETNKATREIFLAIIEKRFHEKAI
jgi:hypothetical protein